jgi:hypothetical protein
LIVASKVSFCRTLSIIASIMTCSIGIGQ